MDWDALIEVLSESVKDETVRADIYKKLFDLVGTNDADDSLDQDFVFDDVYEKYVEDLDDDEPLYEDDEDGFNYDDE
jgi:hypothetical protein